MGWQPDGSSASFPRRWQDSRCGGLTLSRTLTMFTRCEWVTYPPSLGHTKAVPVLAVLLLTFVLGYDF